MAGGRTFVIRLITDSKQTEEAFKKVGVAGATFNKSMLLVSAALSGLFVGFQKAVSAAMEYDKTLLNLTTQIGMTQEAAQELGDALLQMTDLRTSPQELADAFYFIASAGLEGAAAMEAMEYSAKAAAIGMGETETVADLLTTVLNAYGTEAISAQEATDTLLKAVRDGKAEASEMAAAIGQVIPIAASMGVRFEDVATSIAILTRNGAGASDAVTQLRAFLVAMLQPSKEASDAFARMGLTSREIRDAMAGPGGLWSALTLIQEATGGSSTAFAEITGRVEALNFLNSTLGSGLEANAELFREQADAIGITDAAFIESGQTVSGQLDLLSSQWAALTTQIGQAPSGPIKTGITNINRLLRDTQMLFADNNEEAEITRRRLEAAATAYAAASKMLEGLTGAERDAAISSAAYQANLAEVVFNLEGMNILGGQGVDMLRSLNEIQWEGVDSTNGLTQALDEYLSRQEGQAASADRWNAIAAAYDNTTSASDDLKISTEELKVAYDEVAASTQAALDAQLRLISPQLALIEAEEKLRKSIEDGRKVVEDAKSSDQDRAEALLRTEEAAARYMAAQDLAGVTAMSFVENVNPKLLEALGLNYDQWLKITEEIYAGFDAQKEWDGMVTSSEHVINIKEVQSVFGSAPALTGTRATGGPVMQGGSYLVGEAGPELFVPNVSGTIIPNDRMANFSVPTGTIGSQSSPIVVNVSGAIDPEGTARTIIRVLEDAQRRTGARLVL